MLVNTFAVTSLALSILAVAYSTLISCRMSQPKAIKRPTQDRWCD
jgi:hypothetical protein